MKKSIFLFFFIALFINAFAQKNLQPATVVFKDGKTKKGLIHYKTWNHNPSTILFGSSEKNMKAYGPGEVDQFTVEGVKYQGAVVDHEVREPGTAKLNYKNTPDLKKEALFLEVLFEGEKSLYQYRSGQDFHNFYIKKDGNYELLIYKLYYVKKGENRATQQNNKFLGQLRKYLGDCGSIEIQPNNPNYKKQDLKRLFTEYYECVSEKPEWKKERRKTKLKFGAVGGIAWNDVHFSAAHQWKHLTTPGFDSKFAPSVGVSMKIFLPQKMWRLQIHNELMYTAAFKATGSYTKNLSVGNYEEIATEIGMGSIALNTMFRYTLGYKGEGFFLGGGMANGIVLEGGNKLTSTRVYDSFTESDEELALPEFRKYNLGFLAGIGYEHKGIMAEIRYEFNHGMSKYGALNSRLNRVYFLVGYSF